MENIIEALSIFSDAELKQEIKRREAMNSLKIINKVFAVVCDYYSVTEKAVLNKGEKGFARGKGPVRNAKRVIMYILRFECGMKTHKVGLFMSKNHSTITVATNKVKGEMEVSPRYEKEINHLIELIKQ